MPARTSRRGALLALVLSCLLLLAGLVPTQDGARSPGTAGPSLAVAGDPVAAPRVVPVPRASYGARMSGRATTVIGHLLAPLGAGVTIQLADRVASLTDRTSSGPGDHLGVGPAVSGLTVPASRPAPTGSAVAVAASAPQDTFPARAPPGV